MGAVCILTAYLVRNCNVFAAGETTCHGKVAGSTGHPLAVGRRVRPFGAVMGEMMRWARTPILHVPDTSSGAAERPSVLSPGTYAPSEAPHETAGRGGRGLRTLGQSLVVRTGGRSRRRVEAGLSWRAVAGRGGPCQRRTGVWRSDGCSARFMPSRPSSARGQRLRHQSARPRGRSGAGTAAARGRLDSVPGCSGKGVGSGYSIALARGGVVG